MRGIRFVADDDDNQTLRLKLDGGSSNNKSDSITDIISESIKQEILKKFFKEEPKPKKDDEADKKPKAKVYSKQDVFCISICLTVVMFWTGPFIWVAALNTLHSYAGIVNVIAK
jgi:hypothetical protein